jgi:CMP/dCMP kinase
VHGFQLPDEHVKGITIVIVAVDGPSAAGKGTLARGIAKHYGFHFLDTGALYRMVGLQMIRTQTDFSDAVQAAAFARDLNVDDFEDHELRSEVVGSAASKVAVVPEVRSALLKFQRDFAKRLPGAVLDGRDIGTVICPDADVKFFITASVEARVLRRFKELQSLGIATSMEDVAADIKARDARDAIRTLVASDAILVDTSDLGVDEALRLVLAAIEARTAI